MDQHLKLSQITFDLHKLPLFNVMTEYEERFSSQGLPIYRCVATFPGPVLPDPAPLSLEETKTEE